MHRLGETPLEEGQSARHGWVGEHAALEGQREALRRHPLLHRRGEELAGAQLVYRGDQLFVAVLSRRLGNDLLEEARGANPRLGRGGSSPAPERQPGQDEGAAVHGDHWRLPCLNGLFFDITAGCAKGYGRRDR